MVGRIRDYARKHGIRATLVQAARRGLRLVYSEDRMTVLVKDLRSIDEPRKLTGLRIEDLDRRHLSALSALNRKRWRSGADRRFRDYLDRGLHGFVGLRDDEAIAYYWWVEGERGDAHPDLDWLGAVLEMGREDVYGSDFYILPEHRAGGTAKEFLFHVESLLRDRGFVWLWGYVDHGNQGARWLYSSRGYQPMGEVTCRKVLSIRVNTSGTPGRIASHE